MRETFRKLKTFQKFVGYSYFINEVIPEKMLKILCMEIG